MAISEEAQKLKDEELLTILDKWRQIASDAVEPFHKEWDENLDYFLGNQWKETEIRDLPPWRSTPVINVIFPVIEQAHSLLGDQRQEAFAFRQAGGTARMERIITSILEQIWRNENVEKVNSDVNKDRLIVGTGIYKTTWDLKTKKVSCQSKRKELILTIYSPILLAKQ